MRHNKKVFKNLKNSKPEPNGQMTNGPGSFFLVIDTLGIVSQATIAATTAVIATVVTCC